jgi:hypothetical protein
MTNNHQIFISIVLFIVLFATALFIYWLIGPKKIVANIFLGFSSIVILHLLLLFLLVFYPTILPSFLTEYADQFSEWIFKLTGGI